jgi:hypothetical protein
MTSGGVPLSSNLRLDLATAYVKRQGDNLPMQNALAEQI